MLNRKSLEAKPVAPIVDRILASRWIGFGFAAIGLLFVPIIRSCWVTQTAGWLLEAIVHEGGHTLMALSMGQPALPRISLDGHVPYTAIGETQYLWVCILVWLGLLYLCIRAFQLRFLRITATMAFVLYPLIAFSQTRREVAILLAGHGGELLFAGICLFRAQTGLFTFNTLERVLYAVVGWYLVFLNITMCLGLLFDPETRAQYVAGPEEGHLNDYVVAAYEVLYLSEMWPVVVAMLVTAIAVYPLALLYARDTRQKSVKV